MKKAIYFLFTMCMISQSIYAQEKQLQGTILDSGGAPINGATIKATGTDISAVSNAEGAFEIKIPEQTESVTVSISGYKTQTVTITNLTSVNVNLEEEKVSKEGENVSLEEVVVVGYGTQNRSKVTNSIAKVDKEKLTTGLFSNPAQALAGAVSGLRVLQTSGDPGAVPTIILRGGTNLDGSGSPLVVVDGQVRGGMQDINPEDIESMEVLKDAGATAIYGARANNGVIIITTKKGKVGTSQISVKVKTGLNYSTLPYDFLGSADYLYWMRTAYKRSANIYQDSKGDWKGTTSMSSLDAAQPYGTGNLYWDPNNPTVPLDGNKDTRAIWSTMKYTDDLSFLLKEGWQTMDDPIYGGKLIFKEQALSDFNIVSPTKSQDYNINMSGGNEKGKYYAGLGYNHQEGTPVSTFYTRLNFTFNGEYKIKDWLTSYSGFQFTEAKWKNMPGNQEENVGNYFSRSLSLPPTFRGYNASGEMLLGPNSGDGNQQYNDGKFDRDNQTDKFNFSQAFNFNFTKGLDLKITGIWYFDEGLNYSFNKDYLTKPGVFEKSRSTSAAFSRGLRQTYNGVLSYKTRINDHNINALLGAEYFNFYERKLSASGSGAATDDFGNLQYTQTGENMRAISNSNERQRILSYFGRVNYDYKDKYLFSFVLRSDGYSTLSSQNRWGAFPGISGGWIMSQEDFFNPISEVITFAKLRASYGINGNVSGVNNEGIGSYTVQGKYGNNRYNSNTGYLMETIPNPYLTWEKSKTFEFGLDMVFRKSISANFTYYNRTTTDKFAYITLPASSGITSVLSNNGEIQNQGLEYDFNFKIIQGTDWKWSIGLNGAYNYSKIVKLPNNGLDKNRQNAYQVYTGNGDEKQWVGGYQEGEEVGVLYAFEAEGIYNSYDEINGALIDKSSGNNGANNKVLYGPDAWAALSDSEKAKALPIQPGDVKWKDVNGDGVIDDFDKVKIGNTTPRFTGGFNSTLSWKNLSLYSSFEYALGYYVNESRTPWIMGNMQGTYNTIAEVKDTWSPENTNGKYPIYAWADQLGKRNYARSTSMFMYRGDYLAIRELSLSYRVPTDILKKAKISTLELSVTGQNLGYLTAVPHMTNTGVSDLWGNYPLPKSLILGLNITL